MKAAAETKAIQTVSNITRGVRSSGARANEGAPIRRRSNPPAKRAKPVPARGPIVGFNLAKVMTPKAPKRVEMSMNRTPNKEAGSPDPGE